MRIMVMKKTYLKPEIIFESFALTSSIANACDDKLSADTNTCGIEYGFDILFSTGTDSVCNKDEDLYNCYHVPGENTSLFGS